MRMEVDYNVLGENFNFTGYAHSFYSPHFSVNLQKTNTLISIVLNIYPKKISFNFLKLYVKIPQGYSPLQINGKDIFDNSKKYVIFESKKDFLLFSSLNSDNYLTFFNLSKKYLVVKNDFGGNEFLSGKNNLLKIKMYFGTFKDILGSYFEDLDSKKTSFKSSAWFDFYKKSKIEDYKKLIDKVSHSTLILEYFFIDHLKDSQKKIIIEDLRDSNPIPALSISPFLISKSSENYYKLNKYLLRKDNRNFSKDTYVLDHNNKDLLNYIHDYIFEFLNLGVGLIKFENIFPIIKIKNYRQGILEFLKSIVIEIKSEFPLVKISTDVPYNYFSCAKIDFLTVPSFIVPKGSIFKSWEMNFSELAKEVFFAIFNKKVSNISFPCIGFGLNFLSDEEKRILSLMNYLFSDVINFDFNISNYSREEIAISKKMLNIPLDIEDMDYNNSIFKLSVYTNEYFTIYINFSSSNVGIEPFKIFPNSILILDKNKEQHKWPFSGW